MVISLKYTEINVDKPIYATKFKETQTPTHIWFYMKS